MLEERRLLTIAPPTALTPAQVIQAFGLDQVMYGNIRGDGTGQVIAILDPGDDAGMIDSTDPSFTSANSDLHQFDFLYNLPDPPSFKVIGQDGGARPSPVGISSVVKSSGTVFFTLSAAMNLSNNISVNITGVADNFYNGVYNAIQVSDSTHFSVNFGDGGNRGSSSGGTVSLNTINTAETVGDVEWAHVVAPGAAILLIEMNSYNDADIAAAVQTAVNVVGASVVSMSFSSLEFPGQTGAGSENDSIFAHPGVAFVASAGDNGAPANFPSSSPNVLSVGGTNLYLNGDNTYNYEDGWSNRVAIGEITHSGSTVTVTIADQGGFVFNNGDTVRIAGASVPGYDGVFTNIFNVVNDVNSSANNCTVSFQYTDPDAATNNLADATGGAVVWISRQIDDGDTGYATTGTWTTNNTGGYGGDYQVSAAGSGNTATYTFGVPSGSNAQKIAVAMTWVASASNASNVVVQVYDGSASTGTLLYTSYNGEINQQNAPIPNTGTAFDNTQDLLTNNTAFQLLKTTPKPTSGTVTVVINSSSAGAVVADDVDLMFFSNYGGTGGGISFFENQPAYQDDSIVANDNSNDGSNRNTTQRLTPDVAWIASQLTPVVIVDSVNPTNATFYGTSLAAPMWAGLVAIIDQGMALNGKGTLSTSDATNGLQAKLYNAPSSDFHDVISGFNGFQCRPRLRPAHRVGHAQGAAVGQRHGRPSLYRHRRSYRLERIQR